MLDLTKIIRPNILSLVPYKCARDDFKEGILLDANENTHGSALEEISQKERSLDLHRYLDPHQVVLKQQIVDFRNEKPNKNVEKFDENKLKVENLCLGVGSDESIDALFRCTCTPGQDKLLICTPTYGMYSICARVNDVEVVEVPLTLPEFQLDVDAIKQKIQSEDHIKLIYLTSPGNPTGKLLKTSDIIELLNFIEKTSWNGLLIVDEAYIDFTEAPDDTHSESMSTLVNQFPNLVVLQTLSKSFGLAGIRLGITYSSAGVSRYLNSLKYPYNISSLAGDIALRATSPAGIKTMRSLVLKIISERENILERLSRIEGVGRNIGGVDSNFLLVEILDKEGNPSNEVALEVYNKMAHLNNVVVRFRGREPNCTGSLRISIGNKEENEILLTKLELCLKEIRSS